MKVKATPFSSSDWDIFFQSWGQYRCSKFLLPLGNLADLPALTLATFPWGFMTLCIWPMWRLHLGHLMPLAVSMVDDDSGRPWCFPDGSRSGHAITALQLGNVTPGWWSGCWEGGSLTLNLVCSLFKSKDWTNTHTHTHARIHILIKSIAYTHKHTTPQLQGVFFWISWRTPLNMYFLSSSPMCPLFTCLIILPLLSYLFPYHCF